MSDAKSQLHLKVVTPTWVVVDVPCDEVALPGAIGAIGILPGHTPLLTNLRIGEMSYKQGMREHYLALQWGFAEIANDQVTVLAEVAELPEAIEVEAARQQKASAEAALKAATILPQHPCTVRRPVDRGSAGPAPSWRHARRAPNTGGPARSMPPRPARRRTPSLS